MVAENLLHATGPKYVMKGREGEGGLLEGRFTKKGG